MRQVQAALRRLAGEGALLQWWRRLELLLLAEPSFAMALSNRLLLAVLSADNDNCSS